MSEWWTYRLSDFLLFSARTYGRLLEIYNCAIWPAQVAALGSGLAILVLLRLNRAGSAGGRLISAILAACWIWVGLVFQIKYYSAINWAAVYFGWGFELQAVLLIGIGVVWGRLNFERPSVPENQVGVWVFLFALGAEPLAGVLLGRSWKQIEVFGVSPDPTAVATLVLLLCGRNRGRGPLIVIPVIWCAISGAMLLAMRAHEAWIPPLAALLVLSAAFRSRSRPPRVPVKS